MRAASMHYDQTYGRRPDLKIKKSINLKVIINVWKKKTLKN